MDKKVISQYKTPGITLNVTRMRWLDEGLEVDKPVAEVPVVVELAIGKWVALITLETVDVATHHRSRFHGTCAIAHRVWLRAS